MWVLRVADTKKDDKALEALRFIASELEKRKNELFYREWPEGYETVNKIEYEVTRDISEMVSRKLQEVENASQKSKRRI